MKAISFIIDKSLFIYKYILQCHELISKTKLGHELYRKYDNKTMLELFTSTKEEASEIVKMWNIVLGTFGHSSNSDLIETTYVLTV